MGDDHKSAFNFNNDFDRGFLSIPSAQGRTCLPNSCEITTLVDSGTTEHFVDDKLVPGLKERVKDRALLDAPKIFMVAGNRDLHGAATGILHDSMVDQTGKMYRERVSSLIVSGLGRYVSSSTVAMKRSVAKVVPTYGKVAPWCRYSKEERVWV